MRHYLCCGWLAVVLFFPSASRSCFPVTLDKYLFCGKNGNIGLAWKEASEVLGFELSQCYGAGYEIDDVRVYHEIETAVKGKDIICTDSLSVDAIESEYFVGYAFKKNLLVVQQAVMVWCLRNL